MVRSKLDPTLNYKETRTIDQVDIGYVAPLYKYKLYDIPIIIALGKINNQYQEKNNIIYFPIYLIDNKKVLIQIGIYELLSNELPDFLDDDGDLNLIIIKNPLIYSFIKSNKGLLVNTLNQSLLKDEKLSQILEESKSLETSKKKLAEAEEELEEEEDDEDDEEEEEEEEEEDDEEEQEEEDDEDDDEDDEEEEVEEHEENDEEMKFAQSDLPLSEQSKEESDKENREYKPNPNTVWIEEYLHNNNYKIINNEGGGECLFAVIRDGLAKVGIHKSVAELRLELTKEPNLEEIFKNYKEYYNMYREELKKTKTQMQELVKQNKLLKTSLSQTMDRSKQKTILESAKLIKDDFELLKEQQEMTQQLYQEYEFIKNVTDVEEFKEKLKSCQFWADTWAIGTLERILNIKLIIFSSENYQKKVFDNVLLCGHLSDPILTRRNLFEPTYYILADYDGSHYKLITYKNRGALLFKEIPYQIKQLIANKCIEKLAGPFYIIPDFKKYNEDFKVPLINFREGGMIEIEPNLYNDETVLMSSINSNDNIIPGKGIGEKMSNKNFKEFALLMQIPDWRKKLSNYWIGEELIIDGKKWASIEHYLQANKFKKTPEFYNLFSLDSDSKISKNTSMAIAAGSKSGKYNGDILRKDDIKIDLDYEKNKNKLLEKALFVKFTQNEGLKKLLKATQKAKLLHFRKKQEPELYLTLMQIRKLINN